MPSITQQLAEIDQRIAYLEKTTEDLRQQMTQLDKTSHQYLRLSDLLLMSDGAIAKMRAQRER